MTNQRIIAELEEAPSRIDDAGDGYLSADYTLSLTVGEREYEVAGWLHCGWLAAGASSDIDGSGLALWGSSQPGGWRCTDGDGPFSGRPQATVTAHTISVCADNIVGITIDASDIPGSPSLPDEDDDAAVVALDAFLGEIAEEINDAIDAVEVSVEEPSGDDIAGSLTQVECEGVELPVWLGEAYGIQHMVTLDADSDQVSSQWPSHDDAIAAIKAAIKAAIVAATDELAADLLAGSEWDDGE